MTNQYYEALKKIHEEKRKQRKENFMDFIFCFKIVLTVGIYYLWYYLKNTLALQSPLFIWAVGAWTAMMVWEISDQLDELKKRKEEQKCQKKK